MKRRCLDCVFCSPMHRCVESERERVPMDLLQPSAPCYSFCYSFYYPFCYSSLFFLLFFPLSFLLSFPLFPIISHYSPLSPSLPEWTSTSPNRSIWTNFSKRFISYSESAARQKQNSYCLFMRYTNCSGFLFQEISACVLQHDNLNFL